MKRQMFFATAFSAALAVGAAAQTGTGTGSQTSSQQQQVTMNGCLQRDTGSSAAGTSGTATSGTSASSAQDFILANAKMGSASSSTGTGSTGSPAGTSGTAASSSMNKYKLVGGDREDLQKYLNSHVEVRGTLDRAGAGAGAASGTGTGSSASSAQSSQNLPSIRVTSVRQIAATCPTGGN